MSQQVGQAYRLSPRQRSIWRALRDGQGCTAHVLVLVDGLEGRSLQDAIGQVVARYEILRTRFPILPGTRQPVQMIAPDAPLSWEEVDLRGLPDEQLNRVLADEASTALRRPLDLVEEFPLRARYLALGPARGALSLSVPSLCLDQWSLPALVAEIARACDGGVSPEPAVQYVDFSEWLRAECPAEMAPTLRFEKAPGASVAGPPAAIDDDASADLLSGLEDVAAAHGVPFSHLLLASWLVLARRLSGEETVRAIVLTSTKPPGELIEALGPYSDAVQLTYVRNRRANLRALAAALDLDARFSWSEERLRESAAAADLPEGADVGFDFIDISQPLQARGATLELSDVAGIDDAGTLHLHCVRHAAGLRLRLFYPPSRVDDVHAAGMLRSFRALLSELVQAPDAPLESLDALHPLDGQPLSGDAVRPASALPAHARFEAHAARHPEAIAIVTSSRRWTYQEVNARANHLARELIAMGAGVERCVGLCVGHSPELVIGALAILKTGAAFVPLDTTVTPERVHFMIGDAAIQLVVASGVAAAMPHLAGRGVRILVCDSPEGDEGAAASVNLAVATDPDQLAYVIYTSGSTGQPKGVMVPHRGLSHYLDWVETAYLADGIGAPLHSSVAFDLTITTLLAPLAAGRSVVVAPGQSGVDALLTMIRAHRDFSFVKLTPAHLKLLNAQLRPSELADHAGTLIVGGEALIAEDVAAWRARAPRMRVLNEYGPTETVVGCTVYEIPLPDTLSGALPIGRPISGAAIRLRDEYCAAAPAGAPAEIWIAGDGVARGYLGRPALTAERFVPEPLGTPPGARVYRSGDIGRLLPDGNLACGGRTDNQVKIRGHRVELGEIESVLRAHASVRDAVARLAISEDGDHRLIAYVVASDGSVADESVLTTYLQARLPDYMVPSEMLVLPALPLTPNGKVDVKALPVPEERRRALPDPFIAALNPEEEILAGVWAHVLHLDRVGVEDNYFTLGGDSIRSIQVVAQAKERGLEFSVDELFQHPTIRALAAAIRTTGLNPVEPLEPQASASISAADRNLVPAGVEDAYPLTQLQAGMIFHREYAPQSGIYHDISSFHLRAPLDVEKLRHTLVDLARRHPALRTSFDLTRFSEPLQLVHEEPVVALEIFDVRHNSHVEQEAAVTSYFEGEQARSFDSSRLPLIRFGVHARSDRTWQFTVSFHHAILDGWSEATMVSELFQQYLALVDNRPLAVPPPATRFRDFVDLERRALESPQAQEFWRAQVVGSELVTLPRRGVPRQGARDIIVREVVLPADLSDGLKRVALGAAVPLKSVLLAAHFRVMSLVSGRRDVTSCVVSSGRPETVDGDRVLGLFINSIPLRINLEGGTWVDLATAAFHAEARALPFRRYPMSEVKRWVGGRPLSESLFYFTHYHVYQAIERFDNIEYLDGRLYEETSFVMASNFRVDPFTGEVHCTLKCDSTQLSLEQVEVLTEYYRVVLTAMARAPHDRYDTVCLLPAGEQRQLLEWSGLETAHPETPARCLHEWFEAQVQASPGAVALVAGQERRSYRDLNAAANRLARHLRQLGVGQESRVGIYLERSPEVVVAILAVLKAGGGYVPVDPEYPASRVAFILEDAGVTLALTNRRLVERLDGVNVRAVCIEEADEASAGFDGSDLGEPADPAQLAYIIYTSGSTGTPKGTLVEHRHVTRLFTSTADLFNFGPADVWTFFHSHAFDFSVWEIWGALLHGGSVVVVPHEVSRAPEEFHALLERERVTVLNQTPSAFRQLAAVDAAHDGAGLSLRLVIFGGEALDVATVRDWIRRHGGQGPALINMYGITETTVHVTYAPLTAEDVAEESASPIGRPLPDLQIHLLDEMMQPVPISVAGEIYVGGAGLSRGYDGRPSLTASRFVPDPFAGGGRRLYRSGDLARFLEDGTLQYLGRIDDQVKIRGFRVELGEIDAVLRGHPMVKDCAVVARTADTRAQRLIGYAVAAEGASPSPASLARYLHERLPGYMVPSVLMLVPSIPQTPHGKVDRRRLPEPPQVRPELDSVYAAPSTALEEILASIWSDVLRLERVGAHDNFFELGGHSLLATQVVATIREALRIDVPLRALYDAPTVAELAKCIAKLEGTDQPDVDRSFPVMVPDPDHRYDPFPLTDIQQAYWIGRKAEFELGDTPAHIYLEFEARELDIERLNASVVTLIARHDMLRMVVLPDGRQQVLEHVPRYEIPVTDLRGLSEEDAPAKIGAVRERMSHQKFETSRWPLFDVQIERLKQDRARVHFSIDLLVTDADSLAILNRELGQLYRNPDDPLPPLDITFRDYVLTEQRFRQSERYARARAYWIERLDRLPPSPDLPLEKPLASLVTRKFARYTAGLDPETWRTLKRRAVRAGLTPSSLLLAAYCDALGQWSRSQRFTVNVTTYNCLPFHPQVRNLVGDFTYLTLVGVESVQATFELRAKAIQDQFLKDMEHNAFSGLQVLRELSRRQGVPPSMPVVFTSTLPLHTRERRTASIPAQLVTGITQSPQTLIDHQVSEVDDALTIRWDYVDEAFPAGLVEEMFGAYCGMLERLAVDEGAWTAGRAALVPAHQRAVRVAVEATAGPRPAETLHHGFWQQVAARPSAVAVQTTATTWTYAEVAAAATAVTRRLHARGVRRGELVGVVMEPGGERVAAVLGVVGSGAAYLPVEPGLPPVRQAALLTRGGVRYVVTAGPRGAEWPADVEVVPAGRAPAGAVGEPPAVGAPEDLAYVIFTSGSTGVPKGVRIDHAAAVNTVADITRRFGVGPQDRVLALSALGFDLSVYDLFGLLGVGGTVVVPPADAARNPEQWWTLMRQGGVTVWNSVPALLALLLEYVEGRQLPAPPGLRLVLLSGDWIPVALPDRLRRWAPGARVVSLGGATEAAIWSIVYPIGPVPSDWSSIPYGVPLTNQSVRVLNAVGLPVPDAVPGELYIGGAGVAQGYWRDPAQTATRFVPDPAGDGRLYRTGDWGRYRPDGTIEFLGRHDLQVKVGGHRIELGEIETHLAQHPAVARAVVTTLGAPRAATQLAAYIVPAVHTDPAGRSAGDAAFDTETRKAFKARQLGHRHFEDPGTRLRVPSFAAETERFWSRRSHSRFSDAAVGLETLGALLAPLRQIEVNGKAKRAYGSAGGLYPVQVYLAVKPGASGDLPGGTYYYDPLGHRIVQLSSEEAHHERFHWPANREMVRQAAFTIFLAADLRAIDPLYGSASRDFCVLEAGLMTQLLETMALECGLGLCQIGSLDFTQLRAHFRLEPSHILVHSMVGGVAAGDAATDMHDVHGAQHVTAAVSRSSSSSGSARLESELRDYLRARLPEYMLPRRFVFLEALPLSANGKVNRQRLPEPAPAGSDRPRAAAPQASALQTAIVRILGEELTREGISADANFFDLGATSLNLVRLHRRLEADLGRTLPLLSLFEHPNASALAAFLTADAAPTGREDRRPEERAARQRESRRRRVRPTVQPSGDLQ